MNLKSTDGVLLIIKNISNTLIDQTKIRPEEISEFGITKPLNNFSKKTPPELEEET